MVDIDKVGLSGRLKALQGVLRCKIAFAQATAVQQASGRQALLVQAIATRHCCAASHALWGATVQEVLH